MWVKRDDAEIRRRALFHDQFALEKTSHEQTTTTGSKPRRRRRPDSIGHCPKIGSVCLQHPTQNLYINLAVSRDSFPIEPNFLYTQSPASSNIPTQYNRASTDLRPTSGYVGERTTSPSTTASASRKHPVLASHHRPVLLLRLDNTYGTAQKILGAVERKSDFYTSHFWC